MANGKIKINETLSSWGFYLTSFTYHNNTYNFYNRDITYPNLGFEKYTACGNGLEKKINCNIWPESDVEMINGTINDYINSDKPFMTYYVTVSGHMAYN